MHDLFTQGAIILFFRYPGGVKEFTSLTLRRRNTTLGGVPIFEAALEVGVLRGTGLTDSSDRDAVAEAVAPSACAVAMLGVLEPFALHVISSASSSKSSRSSIRRRNLRQDNRRNSCSRMRMMQKQEANAP
jgi:hypothetical protein